jgi:hypothetical protein
VFEHELAITRDSRLPKCRRKAAVEFSRLREKPPCLREIIARKPIKNLQSKLVETPCLQITCPALVRSFALGAYDVSEQRSSNDGAHLVLEREYVSNFSVVGLSPQLLAKRSIDQLNSHANATLGPMHAPLHNVAHAKINGDPLQRYV